MFMCAVEKVCAIAQEFANRPEKRRRPERVPGRLEHELPLAVQLLTPRRIRSRIIERANQSLHFRALRGSGAFAPAGARGEREYVHFRRFDACDDVIN